MTRVAPTTRSEVRAEFSYDTEFKGRPNGTCTRVALEEFKGRGAEAPCKHSRGIVSAMPADSHEVQPFVRARQLTAQLAD